MYERSYGYKYAELGEAPTAAEIAKAMRADIKRAVAEGLLPAHWAYSVRSESNAIQIRVQDCPDAYTPCDGGQKCHNVWCSTRNDPTYAHAAEPHEVLTEDAEAARMTLERIHGAYNHDGSEIMVDYFDVRYYGHVDFEDAGSRDFRLREKSRIEGKRAARENGTPSALHVNHSRDGRQTVHVIVDAGDKSVLACGARLWRSSVGRKAELGTLDVTCSKCARFMGRNA